MAKKKKQPNKLQGHYCWVCGQHKANEKFSGRGHANHMCKQCHALPVAERNTMVAVRRAENMAHRYLNEQEIKWLRKKMNDPRPEVREAAQAAHRIKFPRQERNNIKKGLAVFSLELLIHGEVWNEWGDEVAVNMLITMERDGTIHRTDFDAPESDRESKTVIDDKEAKAFLKSIIHEYDALFWDEDLSDSEDGDTDPDIDLLPEYRFYGRDEADIEDDESGNSDNAEPPANDREPIVSLSLEINNGEEKKIVFYNQMHDAPQELFWGLMGWFESDDESEIYDE